MKKKNIIIITAAAVLTSVFAVAAAAAYDSSEDPVISLSYLRDVFKKELLEEVDGKIDNLREELGSDVSVDNPGEENEESGESEETGEQNQPAYEGYEVIELKEGVSLYAASACEIILRSGQALCIAPDATQGIADLTDASEIYNGNALTKNHLCLIPRGDGRGLSAASESVYLMIRGDYIIVEN